MVNETTKKELNFRYVEAVHMGMKGMVLGDGGAPIAKAGVIVNGIQKASDSLAGTVSNTCCRKADNPFGLGAALCLL